jgi:hypothetical protein
MKFSLRSTLKRAPELEALGEEYYSHGLSVGGFVITRDGQYVFAQKSNQSASSLKEDIIGGVLEEIDPFSGEGIINMNRQELMEEINVVDSMVDSIRMVGIVRSSSTDIVIITSTSLRITTSELRQLFEQRQDQELSALIFVAPENLEDYLNHLGGYKPLLRQLAI